MSRDTRKAYMALAKQLEPGIRRAFRRSISDIVDSAVLKEVEAAIRTGDIDEVMRALNLSPEFFAPLDRAISETFRAGAEAQIATIPKSSKIILRFNGRHPRAEALIKEQSGKMIAELLEGQREAIRGVLEKEFTENIGRKKVVLKLVGKANSSGKRNGGVVGLHPNQTKYVSNMRDDLRNLNRRYFVRTLRDRRYEAKIKKSFKSGIPLTEAEIDKITDRYAGNLLKSRGKTIARTEANAALNRGKAEAIDQLVDTGKVKNEAIIKIWTSTVGSLRTRKSHAGLNGQSRLKTEPFDSSSGAQLMYPHDSNAPKGETINCRCSVRYRIDYLSQAV